MPDHLHRMVGVGRSIRDMTVSRVPLRWSHARSRQARAVKLSIRSRILLPPKSAFAGFRFPAEVIVVAVRRYLRYDLSYRDVEELLVERGIEVDHVTVYRWVQRPPPSPCRTAWAERQRRSAVLRAPVMARSTAMVRTPKRRGTLSRSATRLQSRRRTPV